MLTEILNEPFPTYKLKNFKYVVQIDRKSSYDYEAASIVYLEVKQLLGHNNFLVLYGKWGHEVKCIFNEKAIGKEHTSEYFWYYLHASQGHKLDATFTNESLNDYATLDSFFVQFKTKQDMLLAKTVMKDFL